MFSQEPTQEELTYVYKMINSKVEITVQGPYEVSKAGPAPKSTESTTQQPNTKPPKEPPKEKVYQIFVDGVETELQKITGQGLRLEAIGIEKDKNHN